MTTGRFARAEELARAGRYGDAAIAVEQVAAEDVSLLADAAWMCERAGEARRPARKPRQLVDAPRKFQRSEVARVDPLGPRDGLKCVLEFIGEAECDQIGNPALRQ